MSASNQPQGSTGAVDMREHFRVGDLVQTNGGIDAGRQGIVQRVTARYAWVENAGPFYTPSSLTVLKLAAGATPTSTIAVDDLVEIIAPRMAGIRACVKRVGAADVYDLHGVRGSYLGSELRVITRARTAVPVPPLGPPVAAQTLTWIQGGVPTTKGPLVCDGCHQKANGFAGHPHAGCTAGGTWRAVIGQATSPPHGVIPTSFAPQAPAEQPAGARVGMKVRYQGLDSVGEIVAVDADGWFRVLWPSAAEPSRPFAPSLLGERVFVVEGGSSVATPPAPAARVCSTPGCSNLADDGVAYCSMSCFFGGAHA